MFKRAGVPFELYEVDLIKSSDEQLLEISEKMGLGLNLHEMKLIREYFKTKGRNPFDIELQSLGQAWSEHCCYKSSKYFLKRFLIDDFSRYPHVISAIKEDAGVVEFDDKYAYVIKIESHNHPSAIEPYGGAATGIGGIIRDILCMGAKPIALIDPLFFAELDIKYEDLPKGTKHPNYLLSGVVAGIRDYGNRVGIPTVSGCVFFDRSYITNCIVNVGCIGVVKKDKVVPSRAGNVGDLFVLVGGKTGRDGIHGVTFASAELSEKSEEERGAVQLGNPIMKEPLIHACLEVVEMGLITGMKDLGGGGLSCVVGEMAFSAGFGAEIYLDKVPLKEKGMVPWEIWVSESQERMMLTVKPEKVDEVLYIFQKWDIPASVVGKTTNDKVLRIYYNGYKIYEIDIEFIVGAVEYCRNYIEKPKKPVEPEIPVPKNYLEVFIKMISHPNVASKEWVIRQYDHEVKASTVLRPLQGKINYETHGDAAVIKPTVSNRGLAITTAINPWLTKADPYWGTASAFDEMIRNLVAVNSRPHSFVDCLNFGNPEKPDRMWEFVESVKALGWMAKGFGIPCVSGNVSFYNETKYSAIAPTPTLFGVGIVEDITNVNDSFFKGGTVLVVGETKKEFGGSLYSKVMGFESYEVPKTSPEKLKLYTEGLLESFEKFKVNACHDISEGGIAVAIAEMCFGLGVGFKALGLFDFVELFSESNTRWIVEVKEKIADRYVDFINKKGLKCKIIGYSEGEKIDFKTFRCDVIEAENAWRGGMSKYLF
ncbi:MAG: phosphoribosylformylglycinamidine synthase subunit PurL [Archaeoglobaceae archaeon]|nr:phosphoribosylformylglycinamidine synthase subunit PurL [Archaeoglobaceae archaeon]MDW7989120.1 phosphoribosylformylglycinamidine synthase subunit PurL [Archaeoglobaceae archaeon]